MDSVFAISYEFYHMLWLTFIGLMFVGISLVSAVAVHWLVIVVSFIWKQTDLNDERYFK